MGDGGYLKETLIAYKTADETVNNSIALQDDDDLMLPLVANSVHLFEFHLFIEMNTGGIQFGVNGPALTELIINGQGRENAGNDMGNTLQTAYNLAALARTPAGAVTAYGIVSGEIKVSAAGNLVLRWAQNVAVANDTILKKGSWMRVIRI